jgi:hypothetical protein
MLILAHILSRGVDGGMPIRLATIIRDPSAVEATRARLADTVQLLRLDVELAVVVDEEERPIRDLLAEESGSAALVVMGMARITESNLRSYLPRLRETTAGLESTLLVQSNIPDVEFE